MKKEYIEQGRADVVLRRVFLPIFAFVFLFSFTNANADLSLHKKDYSKVSVLFSAMMSEEDKGKHLIGLHIAMRKDWKTYWRRPGDAGIPPYFDWKNSENLKEARVLWPAPDRMQDAYSLTIGYKDEVVFPVEIIAKDASKPVKVKLAFVYGVCLEICVPEERALSFELPGNHATSIKGHRLLTKYYNQVPQLVKLRDADKSRPVIQSVEVELDGTKPFIEITAHYPEGASRRDIFVEASDGFFIVEPKKVSETRGSNLSVFRIDLAKGDKAAELKGKTLTATLVSDKAHTETKWIVQ